MPQENTEKIRMKSISLDVTADATDEQILAKLSNILKEYRTDAKLAKGQIVLNTEDKQS